MIFPGYWYAFSMGIIALGFGMGIYVPSLLCLGWLGWLGSPKIVCWLMMNIATLWL
jgi:hypothetical protein